MLWMLFLRYYHRAALRQVNCEHVNYIKLADYFLTQCSVKGTHRPTGETIRNQLFLTNKQVMSGEDNVRSRIQYIAWLKVYHI